MIIVTIEISTAHLEEYMLLFSRNTLFILIQRIETFKSYNEELNLASYEIKILYNVMYNIEFHVGINSCTVLFSA